jgi:hypothetical protein
VPLSDTIGTPNQFRKHYLANSYCVSAKKVMHNGHLQDQQVEAAKTKIAMNKRMQEILKAFYEELSSRRHQAEDDQV